MTDQSSQKLDKTKDALDAFKSWVETTKTAIADYLASTNNLANQEVAKGLKAGVSKFGAVGTFAGLALAGAIDGKNGVVANAAGAVVGTAVGAAVGLGIVAAGAPVAVAALIGGALSYGLGNMVESLVKDQLNSNLGSTQVGGANGPGPGPGTGEAGGGDAGPGPGGPESW